MSSSISEEQSAEPLGGYRPEDLSAAKEIVFYGPGKESVFPGCAPRVEHGHPDASLLALCAHLRVLQTRWQSRWEATSNEGNAGTLADRQFDDFADRVWPGYRAEPALDPVRCLLTQRATTLDGMRAKAAAIKAIIDAGDYSDHRRDDEVELQDAFLTEVAGSLAMPLGVKGEQGRAPA